MLALRSGFLSIVLIASTTVSAAASQCSTSWEVGLPYKLLEPEVQSRLGPELSKELSRWADRAEWRMMLAYAHILIEATPVRMVDVKNNGASQPFRRIIEYRDVKWLRDLRIGATRPDSVTLGVTYTGCEGCSTIVESDREVTFDASRHILPGDPAKRYIIGLTIARQARLDRFANPLTALPIADMGDPTNGCTDSFYLSAERPAKPGLDDRGGWGSRQHWDMGDEMIAPLRQHPQLH